MADTLNLSPCPFCNSGKVRMMTRYDMLDAVMCDDCTAEGPAFNTPDMAVDGWNRRAATKAAAPADAPELAKLRERVAHLEAMLDARLERKPDDSQEWAKVDGAIAFHLIERHADDWNDAGRMMDAWRDANPRRASSIPAIPGTGREKEGQ